MTQLPEVEVIRKNLEKDIVGKRFKEVTVKTASVVGRHRNRPEFVRALEGRKIEAISRRGTDLLLELDEGKVLVVRLGEHASLTRETATADATRHTQVVATFTTGGALHYADSGKDGQLWVTEVDDVANSPDLQVAGIDPLADVFTWHEIDHQLKARRTKLKPLLVDPSFMIGLGDVYSDEVLWAAGLSGERSSHTLSSQEVRRLYRAVFEVLQEAVKQGTSDTAAGEAPDPLDEDDYSEHLKVYGKEGDPCARCRQPIRRGKTDRKLVSYFCGQCQT
ncbi:MAG TPA: DNA-formamidopyrimidine glycosylase family protein [Egibacteraceae bacterium]|nr:DNA-formamidopyrimidine glycosylase family protein [Egibacteraceae bacterium]